MPQILFQDATPQAPAQTGVALLLTEAAEERLLALFQSPSAPEGTTHLVLGVRGGGCNGFSYTFALKNHCPEDHTEVIGQNPAARVAIPAESLPLLFGSTLDYTVTLEAAQFVVTNPQANSECGCGHSFGV